MAIMNRCCCCDVRVGSIAVAIWTAIATGVSIYQSARSWASFDNGGELGNREIYTAVWGVTITMNSMLFLSAVCLFFGVVKEKKALLIPYWISECLVMLVYLVLEIAIIVTVADGSYAYFDFIYIDDGKIDVDTLVVLEAVLIALAVAIPFYILIELLCLICVISQYQELRDGRGRRFPATQLLVIQQSGYTTGFAPETYDPTPAGGQLPEQQQYYKT